MWVRLLITVYIYQKDSSTGQVATGGIWASKSGKNPLAGAPPTKPVYLYLTKHKVTKANTRMVEWSLWCVCKV